MNNILIIEDDKNIREMIRMHLTHEGYQVSEANNGLQGLEMVKNTFYDLVLLDLMLPQMDGYEVLRNIRTFSDIPVVLVTAKNDDQNKVFGFDLGADDYVCKPFSVLELKSRIKAILRRYDISSKEKESKILTNGPLEVDTNLYKATFNNVDLQLNPKEFKLLKHLMTNIDHVFTKKQLYEAVWDEPYQDDANTVMVHVSHLREKIESNPKRPECIKTVYGIGYVMKSMVKNGQKIT